jgi:hypothetical protein
MRHRNSALHGGDSRSRFSTTVPAALLVALIGLSSSTACITASVVNTVTAPPAEGTIAAAARQINQSRIAKTGTSQLPAVTSDPASIAQALRPALPPPLMDGKPEPERIQVRQQTDGGTNTYLIDAYGDFSPNYSQAFAEFANQLRMKLPGKNKFVLCAYRDRFGTAILVKRFEID